MPRQEVNIKMLLPNGWILEPTTLKNMIEEKTIFEVVELQSKGFKDYKKEQEITK